MPQRVDPDIIHGERLLAQRSLGWKIACSLWVPLVGLGFVMFSIVGWIIGAVLSRSQRMWAWTAMWGGLYVIAYLAMEASQDGLDYLFGLFMLIWLGSLGHAAYLARGVLRMRATKLAQADRWSATATPPVTPPRPDMPTIPLPENVPPQRGHLQD